MPPLVEASLLRTGPELVGTPLTAMDMPLALSPHSLPHSAKWKFFLHLCFPKWPDFGELETEWFRDNPDGREPELCAPLSRKAFVKWARHTSVRGRSPAQSSHSALGAPSAQVTKRSIPAVCSWGWLTHSPLTCRCLGSPDRSSTSTRLLSHGPKLPCKQKCLLTEKPWVQPYHWGIFKTTMNHPSPKTAILLKSYQVICNHTQMYAKSCNQIPNNQKLETTQKSISH